MQVGLQLVTFFYFSELVYIPITVVFNTACTSTSLLELSMASSYFQYACVTYITPYMHAQEWEVDHCESFWSRYQRSVVVRKSEPSWDVFIVFYIWYLCQWNHNIFKTLHKQLDMQTISSLILYGIFNLKFEPLSSESTIGKMSQYTWNVYNEICYTRPF